MDRDKSILEKIKMYLFNDETTPLLDNKNSVNTYYVITNYTKLNVSTNKKIET